MPMWIFSALRISATAIAAIGVVGAAVASLLAGQALRARARIGQPFHDSIAQIDGRYVPEQDARLSLDEAAVRREEQPDCIRLAVFGDSTAVGMGAEAPEATIGSRVATALASASDRDVELQNFAVVGADSTDLREQIHRMLSASIADIAVIMIGANDVTHRLLPSKAARHLAESITYLRKLGMQVVVGTCPDLGAIDQFPEPLRSVMSSWSHKMAQAQDEAVRSSGGTPVPLAKLLTDSFRGDGSLLSVDGFHPNGAGYEIMAQALMPEVISALSAREAGVTKGTRAVL